MNGQAQKTSDTAVKLILVVLALILIMLQYRLWVAEGNIRDTRQLTGKVAAQNQENLQQLRQNDQLRAEISALKSDPAEIEARAREELGLVKPEETFYMLVD